MIQPNSNYQYYKTDLTPTQSNDLIPSAPDPNNQWCGWPEILTPTVVRCGQKLGLDMFISLILLLKMNVLGYFGIVEVRKCSNPYHFVKIVLAPEILTPTELGSVGAPNTTAKNRMRTIIA